MKKLVVAAIILCLSCNVDNRQVASYNFYDSSNYYIKESYLINDSIKYVERNAPYSVENFLLLDSYDFLKCDSYDFYLIFFKDYFFQNRSVMFTAKSYNGFVTFTKSTILTTKGDYLFHDRNIKERLGSGFSMQKIVWLPQQDTVDLVINKTKLLIDKINSNKKTLDVINDNYSEALVYIDSKYYIVNPNYVDFNIAQDFEQYILDSILSLDASSGYTRN